jgi:GAF domain-containing protein
MLAAANRRQSSFEPETMAEAGRNGDFRGVLKAQRTLLDELLALPSVRGGDPAEAYARITEVAAHVVEAGRVGLWSFDERKNSILCLDMYIERDARHISHNVVRRAEAPRYFEAIEHGDVVAADDAYHDPRTAEFGAGYLPAFGIGALLDVPILAARELAGVMCVEHLGGPRKWQARERLLASTLAECAGLVMTDLARANR